MATDSRDDPPPRGPRLTVVTPPVDPKPPSTATETEASATRRPLPPPLPDHGLLEREYFHIQKALESFDSKSLSIKTWSVTLAMAGVGAAYLEGRSEILLLAAVSALLFWVIEGLWKTFQYAYYARIFEIEGYLSGEREAIKAPQIGVSWSRSFREGGSRRLWKAMIWPHVALPHVAVVFGGVLLYLLAPPG